MSAAQQMLNGGIRATSRIRLRVDVFDEAAKEKGAETEVDRARLCGMDRGNLNRIRRGQTPSLELAMYMSSTLGLKVEQLFEQVDG